MNRLVKIISLACCIACSMPVIAQFNLKKAVGAATKAAQAVTLTDAQMTAYVKEYIDWMDAHNKVCEPDHPYTQRLDSLTQGLTSVEGIPLNFKVYWVVDVNAFACADGSVRVFAALMDIMSDEELLGVIGHEIGHVAHHDSKKAFKQSLLTSALKDGIGSTGNTAAALTDSQLGDLGEAVRTRRMVLARHDGLAAMLQDGVVDAAVVRRDDGGRHARGLGRALVDAADHGFAGNVLERLAGQARRCVARWDDTENIHGFPVLSL